METGASTPRLHASGLRTITAKFMVFTVILTVILLGAQGIYVVRSNNSLAREMLLARGDGDDEFHAEDRPDLHQLL